MFNIPKEAQFSCFLLLISIRSLRKSRGLLFSHSPPEEVSNVVLRLFCFSEVAIEFVHVVTGVSRNALRGECLHLQVQGKNRTDGHLILITSVESNHYNLMLWEHE